VKEDTSAAEDNSIELLSGGWGVISLELINPFNFLLRGALTSCTEIFIRGINKEEAGANFLSVG
jgi:hypothetical protein